MTWPGRFTLLAAGLLGACDSAPPTAPAPPISTPQPPPPSPVPPFVTYVLRGDVVDENGAPVPGADVQFLGPQVPVRTVTDSNGVFEATVELRQRGTSVRVQKADYESSDSWISADTHGLVRMYSVYRLAAGDTVQLSLGDGAYCGFEFEYACRRVRVRSGSRGTLTMEVAPADFKITIGPLQYPDSSRSRLSVSIGAGVEIAVDVLYPWTLDQPKLFTLKTTLEPV